jgi:hypothetical protein
MGNFEYSHKPKRLENMKLIWSVGSAINTENGMVYPLKKNSGAILWDALDKYTGNVVYLDIRFR